MRFFILDTEYLSWNKSQSNFKKIRSPSQMPEIIQFYSKEIFTKKKNEIELFFKPKKYKTYPYRMSKLTGINKSFLNKHGLDFKKNYSYISDFYPKNSLIIANGAENELININKKINGMIDSKVKVFFLDLQDILKSNFLKDKRFKKIFISTNDIKKHLSLKNIRSHNSKNDVEIIFKFLKKNKINPKKILTLKKSYKKTFL
jgi:hypothetical protein